MSRRQPNPPSPVVLPDELIAVILSRLTVKTLMRLRCVSKSWNTLISDPTFVNMHLHRSARNAHVKLIWERTKDCSHVYDYRVVPLPVRRLLENSSTTVPDDPRYSLKDKDCCWVVGSCNGLVCLLGYKYSVTDMYKDYWLRLWNPTTRITSENFGSFRDFSYPLFGSYKFLFGYDNSTRTYKVVAFRVDGDEGGEASWRSEVGVLNFDDNSWRNIQSFHVVPFGWLDLSYVDPGQKDGVGVHLSGSLNWLALRSYFSFDYDWKDITIEQFLIVSLDLSTETYAQLLLPQGFDEVPRVQPSIQVLMDCLCFSHDFKGTDFVIWQMKEFGVQTSWTQLLKISYQNLQIDNKFDLEFQLLPLCLCENGDTLILANDEEDQEIIYNWRDSRVKRTRITNDICWFLTTDYVESLVSTS